MLLKTHRAVLTSACCVLASPTHPPEPGLSETNTSLRELKELPGSQSTPHTDYRDGGRVGPRCYLRSFLTQAILHFCGIIPDSAKMQTQDESW